MSAAVGVGRPSAQRHDQVLGCEAFCSTLNKKFFSSSLLFFDSAEEIVEEVSSIHVTKCSAFRCSRVQKF